MTPAQTMRENTPRIGHSIGSDNGMVTLPRLALRILGQSKGRGALAVLIMLLAVLLLTDIRMQYVSLQEDLYLSAFSPGITPLRTPRRPPVTSGTTNATRGFPRRWWTN